MPAFGRDEFSIGHRRYGLPSVVEGQSGVSRTGNWGIPWRARSRTQRSCAWRNLRPGAKSASQARIVRAFYDADERLLVRSNRHALSHQTVRNALDDLTGLVEQAHKLGSEDFSLALEGAAKEYFANVEAIQQQTAPQKFHRRH